MFQNFVSNHNLPSFKLGQINRHFYHDLHDSFDKFTTLSKDLRTKLNEELEFSSISIVKKLISKDGGTTKYLFKQNDGKQMFETVLMSHKDGRNTVCVSCMIGCPVGCTFCATGKMGFLGNLNSKEIIDQVLHVARELKDNKKEEKVTNIVFMGMGEPLLNLDNVWQAISILTDPKKFALGMRRITISTAGYINGIKKLTKLKYKGKLAISLHSPTQILRERIMNTAAKANDLDDLMISLREFQNVNSNRISFEYILIKDMTDTHDNADDLIELLQRHHIVCHVNLIPYNPVVGVDYQTPDRDKVKEFSDYLWEHRIDNTIRVTMGADVNAACGQLANSEVKDVHL